MPFPKRLIRIFTSLLLISSLLWLCSIATKHLTLLQTTDMQIANYKHQQIQNKQIAYLKKIIVISEQPYNILQNNIIIDKYLNKSLLTLMILIFSNNNDNINKQKNKIINSLGNFHKIMNKIVFVNDYITVKQIQSINFNEFDVLIFNEKNQLVNNLVKPSDLFTNFTVQLSQYENLSVFERIQDTYAQNNAQCSQLFEQLIQKTQLEYVGLSQHSNQGLIYCPQPKTTILLDEHGNLRNQLKQLSQFMIKNGIQIIYLPTQIGQNIEQNKIIQIIIMLVSLQFKFQVKTNSQNIVSKIKRNLILNDLQLQILVTNQQMKDYKKQIMFSTVLSFVAKLGAMRKQIITNELKIIVYDDAIHFPQHIDNIKKQFNVQTVFQLPSNTNNINPIYIVQKANKSATNPQQVKKLSAQYEFVYRSSSDLSPMWVTMQKQFYSHQCSLQQNRKYSQYFVEYPKFTLLKQYIQLISRTIQKYIIYYCVEELGLLTEIGASANINKIIICHSLQRESKKIKKISILNDFSAKVKIEVEQQINENANFAIIDQQLANQKPMVVDKFNKLAIKDFDECKNIVINEWFCIQKE